MPTLNASKWGYVVSSNFSSHAAARGQSTGFSVASNPSSGTAEAIRYRRFSAKGGATFYAVTRAFYYFDTSAITGTVSAATLNIRSGAVTAGNDVIVVKSTAFGGNGSSNLATSDLGNVSFSATRSGQTTYSSGTNNAITLNATALTEIQNNNAFIVAVLQYSNDHQDSALGTNDDLSNEINYATTGFLDYTISAGSGPADVTSLSGIAKADITSINTIAIADITSINTVS